MSKTQSYQKLVFLLICAHLPLYAAATFFTTGRYDALLLQGILILVAGIGYWIGQKKQNLGNDCLATALALTPAILVYIMSGTPWQIDSHMYFFAVLAMTVGFNTYRAILAAAAAIALHHLSLNFLLPYALFPEGANFLRVLFHAVIVIGETAVLLYIVRNLKASARETEQEALQAKKALEDAETARAAQKTSEEQAEKNRVETLNNLAKQFEEQIGQIIESVNQSTFSLRDMSSNLSATVEETSNQSANAAKSSNESSNNVQTVAAAAEEMVASIQEISRNVSSTATAAKTCAETAHISQEKLHSLQQAVSEIDSVIQAINEVAEQTNLLALNATIEAARAGEAGKGFAVVASEVKTLANETHKMTEEIFRKVGDIKSRATETITSVSAIIDQITTVDEQTTNVADAIKEQNSSTAEISRNIQEAAMRTDEVSRSISQAQLAASESSTSTGTLNTAANALAAQATHLQESVSSFLKNLRTT